MTGRSAEPQPSAEPAKARVERRAATAQEAKAAAHPLRLRILRLCAQHELTNKQLADRLDRDPGTVLYHVRILVDAGFLEQAPVRTGVSGALEKPYRATGVSWRLALDGTSADGSLAPIEAFQNELNEAGPGAVKKMSRFALHLSPEDAEALALRIVAVLDDFTRTDGERSDQPLHGGIFVVHRLAE